MIIQNFIKTMLAHDIITFKTSSTSAIKKELKLAEEEDTNYSQRVLIIRLLQFSRLLEKKLETELGDECKTIPPVLERKDVAFLPHEKLTPLKKLKIVKYILQEEKKDPNTGYCFGLTMVLISNILLKKDPEEFYSMVRTIINCPRDQLLELEDSISDFYFSTHWAHFPDEFYGNESKTGTYSQHYSKEILSQLTETPIEYYHAHLRKNVSQEQFEKLLEELNEEKIIRLSTLPTIPTLFKAIFSTVPIGFHTLTIFCDKAKNFYVYDSNYKTGRAKKFIYAERDKIYDEIIERGYENFDMPIPNKLHLNFDIFQKESPHIQKKTISRTFMGCNIWGASRDPRSWKDVSQGSALTTSRHTELKL